MPGTAGSYRGKRMDCAYLSDAELFRVVDERGEHSLPALHELEQRHAASVSDFAAVCAVQPPAAAELARQAWQALLGRQLDSGALRPAALASVLHVAAGWARGRQRTALHPQLTAWTVRTGGMPAAYAAVGAAPPPTLVARAFAELPYRSQTVLWHQAVEFDDSAVTGRLSGAVPGEVAVLAGRAREGLYNHYVRGLRDGLQGECLHYHRLVLAYADSRAPHIAAEVGPHLESCARCARVVDDLGRVRHDSGALLAQALLPWGGLEYAARRSSESRSAKRSLPRGVGPGAGGAAVPAADGAGPGGAVPEVRGTAARAPGAGRHAASGPPADPGGRRGGRRRADLIVRGSAVAGVCAVGALVAFGLLGDSSTEEPQSQKLPPPARVSVAPTEAPEPSATTATAKPSPKPPKPTKTRPKPPAPSPTRPPAPPPVRNAAVEWLFDDVNGSGLTPDSSGNGRSGTLFGTTRPAPVKGGGLSFSREQFVAAPGPLVDTDGSFSVSARVELDRTDVSQTVVSQDSRDASAFALQYDADEERWEFRLPEEDTGDADSDADVAVSGVRPEAGEPVLLTGVYDDEADEVRIYVDGRLGETAGRDGDFPSRGLFAVGRGLSENRFFQGLAGTVSDVRAYGRALSSAEAKSLAARD